jgi:hypothetical protein
LTPEVAHVEVENPDNEANTHANMTSYDDNGNCNDRHNDENEDVDKDEDEANTDEVTCKLLPSHVLLGKRTCKSIYFTICLTISV